DITAHAGERVVVVGTYQQLDVRMREVPPPEYLGHASVVLSDGTLVLLEPIWADAAIRSEEERAVFDGKRVRVTGTLHARAPEPPEPDATMINPAISPVECVEGAADTV
ncbi:MAG: hypothetical protein JRI25_17980, partial [Deltaproteobacteria bacterium]|nr:hypothetical protein [Deltaproteobacteria bacterium]